MSVVPNTGERVSRRRERPGRGKVSKNRKKAFSCHDKCYFGNYFSFTEPLLDATDRSKGIKCAIKRGIFQAFSQEDYVKRDRTIDTETPPVQIRHMIMPVLPTTGERVSRRESGCNMGKFQELIVARRAFSLSCDDSAILATISLSQNRSCMQKFRCTDRSKGIKCAIKRGIFQALPSEDPVKMRQNYLHRDTTTGDSTNDYVCSANYTIYTETPPLEIRQMIMSVLPTTGERVSRRKREAVIWESFQEQKKLSLATISAILATIFFHRIVPG
ncbi:hypothetical protein CEXT_492841 [Caerostris extrusa]|uniref:Uncharacterized protein n=1 Tax=Caerostris extrusa TaxID=172846 RepID=A0AAV4UUW9_CAEEX|nr:hypothetical protein CEXT_492841 [Caerostris extrusa]